MQSHERKSATVRLVLMGAAVGGSGLLAGCSGEDVQRNRYASPSDCVADYSDAQCRPDYPVSGYVGGMDLLYYGPWYRSSYRSAGVDANDPGPGHFMRGGPNGQAAAAPAGIEAGSRGGFGEHGRVSARGG